MRGRNRNKGPNPMTRTYESNGPDVKIRGTAQHIAEKYSQLARDAQSSGDPVAAENYLQHAEHYYRIIAAAQEQFRQQFGGFQRPYDEDLEEGEEEAGASGNGGYGYLPQGDRPATGPGQDDVDLGLQPQPYAQQPYEGRGEGNERPQRFERGDRAYERGGRPERGERSERGPRPDRRERFARSERAGAGDEPPRQERRERRPESEDRSGALPAFLTNPVRQPIAVDESAESEAAPTTTEAAAGEANGRYRTRRRRRPTRAEGSESGGDDFTPENRDATAAE